LRELGAVIHSVDLVASGKRIVEDIALSPKRQ
jgi:hypothetical protein